MMTFYAASAAWCRGRYNRRKQMCRNIKPLFNYDPPVADVAKITKALIDSLQTNAPPRLQ